MINIVFIELATRLNKENDLSDITWALIQSNKEFKYFFLDFFKFNINKELPCEIARELSVRFDKLNGIYFFSNLVKHIFDEYSKEGFDFNYYDVARSNRAFGNHWAGYYCELKRVGGTKRLFPFIGIEFINEELDIVFYLDDWSPRVYEKYKSLKGNKKDDFVIDADEEGNIVFRLKPAKTEAFKKASLKDQETIIRDFLDSSIDEIQQLL